MEDGEWRLSQEIISRRQIFTLEALASKGELLKALRVVLLLTVLALATPINHDKDQYIGAAMAAASGRPFVDFIYLQTPLQPLLTSPVLMMPIGTRLVALRAATALLGTLLLLGVFVAARIGGVRPCAAALAAVLPTRNWRQYFVLLIPPLFITLALVRPHGLARREWAVALPLPHDRPRPARARPRRGERDG